MPKYYNEILQGSDEWHHMRLGVVTASNINILITPKGKPAKNEKMRNYACEIAAQREMMHVEDTYQSFDMIRGHLQEGIARDVYSDNYAPVVECGFVTNDRLGSLIGCSPDGIVGDEGGIEIKSRLAKFQMATIIKGEVPDEFINQIQTFLMITERSWCDYVQYSNGMPLFVKRVKPDPVRQEAIMLAILEFEEEVQRISAEYAEKSAGLVQCELVDYMADDMPTGGNL
jgi:hypothetical protein